jgi:pyruvate formate lyase activating enzyme
MVKGAAGDEVGAWMRASAQDPSGQVFDVQRFSIHDGPGIRTTVFLKGCSLRCFWCHNPESWRRQPELEVYPARCIGCGSCAAICPRGACTMVDGRMSFDAARCDACFACVDACFANGLVVSGYETTASSLIEALLEDRVFYANSGGGVTLSGGEPVLQCAFARAILAGCHAAGIHTAIETAGNYPWRLAETLMPVVDLVMMDLKLLDADRHRAATGVSNHRILENARHFALTSVPLLFRTPVIPTVNDAPDDIRAIAEFVAELACLRGTRGVAAPVEYALLPFHQLAGDKYASLGREYRARALTPLTTEQMEDLRQVAMSICGASGVHSQDHSHPCEKETDP